MLSSRIGKVTPLLLFPEAISLRCSRLALSRRSGVVTRGSTAAPATSGFVVAGSIVATETRCKESVRDLSTAVARIDGIAHVPNGVNQRRIADFSSQASDENLHQLGVIFVRVFPYPFA